MSTATANSSDILVNFGGESIKLLFKPVERGTKHKIDDKTSVLIDGYRVSEDGKYSFIDLSVISDYRFQLSCLIDRLFHPDKYSHAPLYENVDEHIENLICWLMEHTEKEHRHTITELVAQIKATPEHLRAAAEMRIYAHIKESGV